MDELGIKEVFLEDEELKNYEGFYHFYKEFDFDEDENQKEYIQFLKNKYKKLFDEYKNKYQIINYENDNFVFIKNNLKKMVFLDYWNGKKMDFT